MTPEIEAQMILLYGEGASMLSTAQTLGFSEMTVSKVLEAHGIRRRPKTAHLKTDRNPTKGKGHTSATRQRLSSATLAYFAQHPEARAANREATLHQLAAGLMPRANTSIERTMMALLDDLAIPYNYQARFGYWVFDFLLLGRETFVECDGDYWHGHPDLYPTLNTTQRNNRARGQQKEAYAIKHGYTVLRFWERDIAGNSDPIRQRLLAAHAPLPQPSARP